MGTVLDKNSAKVRKRIEDHAFDDEEGEEYEGSKFNGFGDYFRRKKIKLQNLDVELRSGSDKPQLFKGIVAHVTGYTQPPLHVLHRDIVQHGGGFLQYLDSKTMATHIIASTLPPKKSVDFSRYRIVKPAWIVDSIAAGKLLPWTEYRVIDEGPRQKVLRFDGVKGVTQESPRERRGYKEQTENSFYAARLGSSASSPSLSISQIAEPANTSSLAEVDSAKLRPPETPSKLKGQMNDLDTPQSLEKMDENTPEEKDPAESEAQGEEQARPLEPPENATSEEHNAWLLSDPRLRKSSTANPDFLKQFYSESRLHHLSTWKADLKSKMQRMAAEKGVLANANRRKSGTRRYIMHVDFDSFFCAVSLKRHPEFVDKPAVVAHSTGSGSEIASCNYPAREFGVKNGMWMKTALEKCPHLKVLPYDFPAYEDASRLFYESILDCGGLVQSVSVDEALVDITSIVLSSAGSKGGGLDEGSVAREQDKVDEIAMRLREDIKAKTGCHVSVGIGGNILQAKVAMRKAKPAGQYQLKPEDVLDVIGELKVESLPGVAYSIGGKLEEIGVKLVKELRALSKERLVSVLGPKTGEKLRDYSRGIDRAEVGEQPPRKSVSAEVNWGIRFLNQPEAEEFIFNLSKELERRLLNEHVKGRQLTMKIMRRSLDAPLDPAKHLGHGKCDVFNKSITFGVPTHSAETIGREAVSILRSFKFSPGDLRGLGIQMTKLEPIKDNPTAPEGSQRKLTFHSFSGPSPARGSSKIEAIDDGESPVKERARGPGTVDLDPITEDPLTPRKARGVHPAMALAKAGHSDSKARTPLNVSGTQFIIPSNVDATTLAELPSDIRSKVMGQKSAGSGQFTPSKSTGLENQTIPNFLPSQVDADVFNALPDDMKAEILESYGRRPAQAAVQQSPTKDQAMQKPLTPTKKSGIKSMLSNRERQRDAQAGLVQTNFTTEQWAEDDEAQDLPLDDLNPDFLAELPEEVRKEIIDEHRRRRLAQRSGLDAPARKHPHAARSLPGGQQQIRFPPPPPKISFASSDATSTQELKDMLDAWHLETRDAGPHRRDVEVFEKYLVRVVREERDLEKATKLVKWLEVIVVQDHADRRGRKAWGRSLDGIKEAVQGAVKARGLAPLNF